jgi:transposase
MDTNAFQNMTFTDVRHLPIVKSYANKIRLVDTINHLVDTQMELDPGTAVMAMVIDTLSGRSPLYRLSEFFDEKDTELLLGKPVPPERFSDYNLGRAIDKIYETGTQKIFSQISQNAIGGFEISTLGAHYDTTSISLFGDYELINPPFEITYGHSKDKRPDLKQFLVEMLCVDRNIPIFGATRDGNASDKTLNNELLTNISSHMAKNGLDRNAYVYVADSAFVTPDNLKKAQNIKFISRLPATYKECRRVIQHAVAQDDWVDIGTVVQTEPTTKRPAAFYRAFDSTVDLYDTDYRAIVIHSSAHDKRRHKRIERQLKKERDALMKTCKKACAAPFFCEPDAKAAADKLLAAAKKSNYHRLETTIEQIPKFPRGRPVNGKPRIPDRYEFTLKTQLAEDPKKIEPLRFEAGCFVLLSNLTSSQERKQWDAEQLLRLYKNQSGIEQNFGFLKDPVIVNSIFLKKATRIEVLGLVLLIALLIWRLMERSMRQYVVDGRTLTGWKKRQTTRPTSFMMTTKFITIYVAKLGQERQLVKPLKPIQLEYLRALNVDPDVYISP